MKCKDKVLEYLQEQNRYILPERIALMTDYSLSTIKKALKELKEEKKVVMHDTHHRYYLKTGKYKINKYWSVRNENNN